MKQLQMKKHMMTAISYLIPFVCAAGMLMVIGNIAGGTSVTDLSKQLAIPDLLTTLGGQALGFLPVVISTGIAYSIADKAGIAPGVIMGCCQITEGSYPIILNDLLRITICTVAGAGVAGAMAAVFKVSSKVPAGGFFALPGINYPQYWLLSLLVGSVVFGLLIQVLKRKPNEDEVEEEKEINLSDLKIS